MSPAASPPLSQLSRYELITQLGEGGMARVFLAISRGPIGFNKLMVVKQIRPELAADSEFLGMFLDEARIALALHHPNIVETYEIFEEDGRHLMAMEYLDGQTQADLLFRMGRDRMPLEEHIWILTQVLAALHHAHELRAGHGSGYVEALGIVHRDVSPSNVFLTYDGRVKLLDFGIAKATGAISTTARGTVKAKIGYGAPEQFLGHPIDRRADIFSVGVMLWEALAGCRRKIGETRNAMIEARISGLEPSIRAVRPGIPSALAAICDRATALRPESRHDTAAELGRDLERWLTTRTRVVGARDVGALMNRHFAAERQARRQSIERQLGGSDTDPTRSLAPIPTPPTTRSLVTPAAPARPTPRSTPASSGPAVAPRPTPASSRPAVAPRPIPTSSRPAVAPRPTPASPRSAAAPPPEMDLPGEPMLSTLTAMELETPLPDRRRRRVWLIGGAASAAILGATLVLVLGGGSSAPTSPPGFVESRPVDLDRPAVRAGAAPPASVAVPAAPGRGPKAGDRPGGRPDDRAGERPSPGRAAGQDPLEVRRSGRRAEPAAASPSERRVPARGALPRTVASDAPLLPPARSSGITGRPAPTGAPVSPALRSIQPGEPLPRPARSRQPRRHLDEEDPYR